MLQLVALAAALAATAVVAQSNGPSIPTCGPGKKCPSETPCCSQYGQCGVGAYCLGGCDPLFSNKLESCVPNPTCKSGTWKMNSLDNVMAIDKYLGDTKNIDWVSSGKPLLYQDKTLLTMAEGTVGTLLASTHYVWYGKVCTKMTTSQGKGVVTAFILMSDVKDEIDFEFIGVDLQTAQSNFYSQGVTDYTHGKNLSASNTESQMHEYCIDWQPEQLTWTIDGKTDGSRTLKLKDTWNSTSNRYDYPQTPSRIQFSLWPAGLPSNAEGTRNWAGGTIDWNSQYMQNGYYYAVIESVDVKCYDPPPMAQVQGKNAYVYTDAAGTNNTVKIQDKTQILKSFYATGENPDKDPNASKSKDPSSSKTASSSSTPSAAPETVPGMSGAGSAGEQANSVVQQNPQATSGSGSGSGSGGGSGGGDSAQPSSSSGGSSGFSQGGSGTGQSAASSIEGVGRTVGGSIFAVWVAVLGLMVL